MVDTRSRLSYTENRPKKTHNRKRNIIWFNPPYSINVATSTGKSFLKLIDKHFPKGSKLRKIFNRSTVKVSYSCMPSVASIIKSHNKKVSSKEEGQQGNASKPCNCRKNNPCPMQSKCLTPSVIYKTEVKTADKDNSKLYIGLTELRFKSRYYVHQQSFRDAKHKYSTELSRHVWELKQKKEEPIITWSIAGKARSYDNETKR